MLQNLLKGIYSFSKIYDKIARTSTQTFAIRLTHDIDNRILKNQIEPTFEGQFN